MSNDIIEKPIEQKILEEDDLDELQSLINLFNLNLKKKDIIRSAKLSEVQDNVVEQILERIELSPEEFSNLDLLNYLKTVQDALHKTDNSLESIEVPTIQINQQVNINNTEDGKFNRESRQRILDVVASILAGVDEEGEVNNDNKESE